MHFSSYSPPPGCKNSEEGQILKQLFHRSCFRVTVVSDVTTVELCGALKVRVREREREYVCVTVYVHVYVSVNIVLVYIDACGCECCFV